MAYNLGLEEMLAVGTAHAISRSESLSGLDRLSILIEYREWICDDPIRDDIWTIPDMTEKNELNDLYNNSIDKQN